MRLHVAVIAAENLLQTVTREVFGDVDELTAAVVALAGIAFGVLVGEMAPHRSHDGGRDDVLAGDEFEVAPLAGKFLLHGGAKLGVGIADTAQIDHKLLLDVKISFIVSYPA